MNIKESGEIIHGTQSSTFRPAFNVSDITQTVSSRDREVHLGQTEFLSVINDYLTVRLLEGCRPLFAALNHRPMFSDP